MVLFFLQIMGKKTLLSKSLEDLYTFFIERSDGSLKKDFIDIDGKDSLVKLVISSNVYFNSLLHISILLGGIGALFYIYYRVWKQLANGEPLAIFPLLRPFFIGLCIIFFPTIVRFSNAIFYQLVKITENISPIVSAEYTNVDHSEFWDPKDRKNLPPEVLKNAQDHAKMQLGIVKSIIYPEEEHVKIQNDYISTQLKEDYFKTRVELINKDSRDNFIALPICEFSKIPINSMGENIECIVKRILKFIVEGLLQLIILFLNIYRMIGLSVLYLIGPLACSLSIFDGFQNSLNSWVMRYVSIYLWLPIANIVGGFLKIISAMIIIMYEGNFWYLLLFGVLCLFMFFKVPQITSWIIQIPMEDGGGFIGRSVNENVATLLTKTYSTLRKEGIPLALGGAAALGRQAGRLLKKKKE